MPNLPNWSPSVWSIIGVLVMVVFAAFPVLLIAYGVVLGRAGRQGTIGLDVRRRGWSIFGLCLLAGAVYAAAAAFARTAASGVMDGLVAAAGAALLGALVLMGGFVRQPMRLLRFVTTALIADAVLLFACVCVTVPIANLSKQMMAYSNFNEAEVRAALARNPNDPAAHSSLAQIDMLRHDYTGEVAEYRQVLRVEPDNQDALLLLGGRLTRAGRIDEAKPLYQKLAAGSGPYAGNARRWLARYGQSSIPLTP